MSSTRRRLIVGISGATGIVFGVRLLEVLRRLEVETHLVVSGAADMTRDYETELSSAELERWLRIPTRSATLGRRSPAVRSARWA